MQLQHSVGNVAATRNTFRCLRYSERFAATLQNQGPVLCPNVDARRIGSLVCCTGMVRTQDLQGIERRYSRTWTRGSHQETQGDANFGVNGLSAAEDSACTRFRVPTRDPNDIVRFHPPVLLSHAGARISGTKHRMVTKCHSCRHCVRKF